MHNLHAELTGGGGGGGGERERLFLNSKGSWNQS